VALPAHVVSDPAREMDCIALWAVGGWTAMLLFDLRTGDPRPAWLRESGAPAVIIGAQRPTRDLLHPDQHPDPMTKAVDHLYELGHRGWPGVRPRTLEHVVRRERSFAEVTRNLLGAAQPQVETDYTARAGVRATRGLLAGRARRPPSSTTTT